MLLVLMIVVVASLAVASEWTRPVRNYLFVQESTQTMGNTTLGASGVVTVNTVAVRNDSRIFLSGQISDAKAGELTVSARTAGTSFQITSSNALDRRDVAWLIINPS